MDDFIEDCDVFAASSYPVEISAGRRILGRIKLKARVNTATGEVGFYVPVDEISELR